MVLLIYAIIVLFVTLALAIYEDLEERRYNKWLKENLSEKRQFEHLNRRN